LSPSQQKAGLLILDGVLGQVISQFRQLYNGEAAVEIAFMGRSPFEGAASSSLKARVYEVLKNNIKNKVNFHLLYSHVKQQSFDKSFPVIYVEDLSTQDACKLLDNNGLSHYENFEVKLLIVPKCNFFS
jgi:hypothetical protein